MLDERSDPLLMDFGLAVREMDEKPTRERDTVAPGRRNPISKKRVAFRLAFPHARGNSCHDAR